MNLSLLKTLKKKLLEADEFGDVMSYFFDHFGEDSDFIALGERAEDQMLAEIIRQVGKSLYPRGAQVEHLLLTRLPEHQFIHGGFAINNRLGNVIYFEDIRTGLMALLVDGGQTKMIRFKGQPLPDDWSPSNN